MSNLTETDGWAVATAIRILSESGYSVEKIGNGEPTNEGVAFTLDVEAPTKFKKFTKQAELGKTAVLDLPELGLGGEILEDTEDFDPDAIVNELEQIGEENGSP